MQGDKVKIVYVLPCCSVSGGIAVVCQHANRLLLRGYDILFLTETPHDTYMGWFPDQQIPVITIKDYPSDVDILIATGWTTSFRVAQLPAKEKIYFVQSDETRFHPQDSIWQYLCTISYCFDFHFMTEARWIQTWLRDNFGKNAYLVPNGLDDKIFYPCAPLEKKGMRPRVLLEGAIGLPYKGMKEAFEAIQDLDVEIWCVSSYGKPEALWRCDRFFEHVPMQKMREIYSSCDILLKLSRVEGFFGPPMEMMACGGVSVVGRVTGYDEYIVDGINALVIDPLDIQAATLAVKQLLADKNLYGQLQSNGIKTAKKWLWETTVDKLEDIFTAILKSPPRQWHPHRTNLNNSIASLYYTAIGQIPAQTNNLSDIVASENVEKLCRRLKKSRFFKFFADITAHIYYRLRTRRICNSKL